MEGYIMQHPTIVRRISPRVAAGLLLLILAGSCEDGTAPEKPEPAGTTLTAIVSDPAEFVGLASSMVGVTSLAGPVTYVSFPPGTFPTSGSEGSLTVRNLRTLAVLTAGLQDGGLDPEPLPADVGDSLEFTIDTGGTQPIEFINEVPDAKRPTVVRTDPKSGKRDVPLNIQLRVIFSEPIIATTVTNSTLVLQQQGSPVAGRIQVSLTGLEATFFPTSPLLPETDY